MLIHHRPDINIGSPPEDGPFRGKTPPQLIHDGAPSDIDPTKHGLLCDSIEDVAMTHAKAPCAAGAWSSNFSHGERKKVMALGNAIYAAA